MKTILPAGCGNAPRTTIVAELFTAWARGDAEAVAARLAEDVIWRIVGDQTLEGVGAAERACPAVGADRLEVTSIVTHGRLASCDGFLETGKGRIGFSHVLGFASAAKTAAIKEIRTYRIEIPAR